jgi:hypothetical protein
VGVELKREGGREKHIHNKKKKNKKKCGWYRPADFFLLSVFFVKMALCECCCLLSPGKFVVVVAVNITYFFLCQAFGGHFADVGGVVGRSGGLQQIVMMDVMSILSQLLLLLSTVVLLLLLVMRRRSVMMLLMFALVTAVVMVATSAVADGTLLFLALSTCLFVDLLDGSQLLFKFHAPILKPDFDLPLSQAKGVSDFDPPPPRQVVIKVKLFLQFQRLVARVSLATSSSRAAIGSCGAKNKPH